MTVKSNNIHEVTMTNIDNWMTYPFSKYSFSNIEKLVPVQKIKGSRGYVFPRNLDEKLLLSDFTLCERLIDGVTFLQESFTDALVVCKNGNIVCEYSDGERNLFSPHLTFSVSKSITGVVAGILLKKKEISPDIKLSVFFGEMSGSAYRDATIRDLLDMTVSVEFDENYGSKQGLFARYRRAMLWMSRDGVDEESQENLEDFILSLHKSKHEHGYRFSYKSPNTDLLGRLLEVIENKPLAQIISEELWQKLGCDDSTITIDRKGMARAAGGISCSLMDLLRIGELIRNGGIVGSDVVLDPMWVIDTFGSSNEHVWKRGDFYESFPSGNYRNQWYLINQGELCAIGIHGQWIYINAPAKVVICKFSSQPQAVNDELDKKNLEFFRGILEKLS